MSFSIGIGWSTDHIKPSITRHFPGMYEAGVLGFYLLVTWGGGD